MTCVNVTDIAVFLTTKLIFFVEELRPLWVIQYQPNNGDDIKVHNSARATLANWNKLVKRGLVEISPVSNALQSLLEYQNLEKKFRIVNTDLAFNDGGIKVYIMARVIRVLELSVFRRIFCDL